MTGTVSIRSRKRHGLAAGANLGRDRAEYTYMSVSGRGGRDGRRAGLGAVAGVLAAATALGVGQFVAGLTGASGSPVVAVGELQIDFTPPWLKNFAISAFGPDDKLVLVTGILLVLAAFAALTGVAATRRIGYGLTGLAVFALVGLTAAATRPDATAASLLPTLAATAAAAAVLLALIPLTGPRVPGEQSQPPGPRRRSFLAAGAATAGVAAAGGLAGRALAESTSVAKAQQAVRIPQPAITTQALPPGTSLDIPGLTPFITSNASFYRVDTALVLPQVDPASWSLRIHGMVEREITLTFDQLLKRPLIEDYITLCCVSNPVGGPYIGNAKWLGASLAALLREAGIKAGADQLMCTSVDGFTSGTPVQVVMDGRDALLAVAMNGTALPVAHGFPARMVTPGLYGYVSATKWVTDIDVTTFAGNYGYWAQRGWSQQAPIKTECRIDVPGAAEVKPGKVTVAGVAWAQHKGIEAVEVRVDYGPWHEARLAAVPGLDTWRQWAWDWNAAPGGHVLQARATDKTGYTQTATLDPPEPDGASGYPQVSVPVKPT
jgi:DMSO/TMAO reductase YedYZ molybdopterin-dependent catalytic subunit